MTIKQAYQQFCDSIARVYPVREALSMARIVFEDEFGISNFEKEGAFSKNSDRRLKEIQNRLVGHEPLQYILGQADFYGLKFNVNPSVLIPRPETEELVYWILEELRASIYQPLYRVLDIGTGSGCIAISLKKNRPILEVSATDVSTKALETAESNSLKNLAPIRFFNHNILISENWDQLGQFDVIVSNPPYIPPSELNMMPLNVKAFEPSLALFVSEADPLVFYRKISQFGRQHLCEGGKLFFETNEFNAPAVVEIMNELGYINIELRKDLNGKDRMIRGERMPA